MSDITKNNIPETDAVFTSDAQAADELAGCIQLLSHIHRLGYLHMSRVLGLEDPVYYSGDSDDDAVPPSSGIRQFVFFDVFSVFQTIVQCDSRDDALLLLNDVIAQVKTSECHKTLDAKMVALVKEIEKTGDSARFFRLFVDAVTVLNQITEYLDDRILENDDERVFDDFDGIGGRSAHLANKYRNYDDNNDRVLRFYNGLDAGLRQAFEAWAWRYFF